MSGYHYENWNGKPAYVRNGSRYDTHGGHGEEHREEMREIARQTFIEMKPILTEEIYKDFESMLEQVVGVIEWDINEVVSASFDDIGEVFRSEKFRKVISSKIMDSIKQNLNNVRLR